MGELKWWQLKDKGGGWTSELLEGMCLKRKILQLNKKGLEQ